jgi:hypothetical protein
MDTKLRLRARSLARPDDLRAFDAGGRLDLIARDDRAGLGQHHPHFHAEVFQPFLDHAAGHFQRFVGHGFLAGNGIVQQVHLGQLAVRHVFEQGLLSLLGDARAARHLDQYGLDQDRCGVMLLDFDAFFDQHGFALSRRTLPLGYVLRDFALLTARLDKAIYFGAQALSHLAPGKSEHQ